MDALGRSISSSSEESNGEDSDNHHNGGLDVCSEGHLWGSVGGARGVSNLGSVAIEPCVASVVGSPCVALTGIAESSGNSSVVVGKTSNEGNVGAACADFAGGIIRAGSSNGGDNVSAEAC